jgi:predicted phosphodiesterase
VFDPVEAGLALSVIPLVCAPPDALTRLFGGLPDAILWASTHAPSSTRIDGRFWVNPGSATLPAENASASFARLTVTDDELAAEIVAIPG